MPIFFDGLVAGRRWGFYSPMVNPMHIEQMGFRYPSQPWRDKLHRVWLERVGKRVIEPDGRIDARVMVPLRKAIEEDRKTIERAWLEGVMPSGRFRVDPVTGMAVLHVYPGTPEAFRRSLDLTTRTADPEGYAPGNWRVEFGVLRLGTQRPYRRRKRIYLPDIVWGRPGAMTEVVATR